MLLVETRGRQRRQQHELDEVSLETNEEINLPLQVRRSVMFLAEDARSKDVHPMIAKATDQRFRIDAGVLLEVPLLVRRLDTDPNELDTQADELLHAQGRYRFGRREHLQIEEALLTVLELEELHRARPVLEEVLIHHEEVIDSPLAA